MTCLEWPLVLESRRSSNMLLFPTYLYILMRSPRSLLCSWLPMPKRRFLSFGLTLLPSGMSLVILSCTLSIFATSPRYTGFQTSMPYSKWGRTYCLNMSERNFGDLVMNVLFIRLISRCAFLHALSVCLWNLRSSLTMRPKSRVSVL